MNIYSYVIIWKGMIKLMKNDLEQEKNSNCSSNKSQAKSSNCSCDEKEIKSSNCSCDEDEGKYELAKIIISGILFILAIFLSGIIFCILYLLCF